MQQPAIATKANTITAPTASKLARRTEMVLWALWIPLTIFTIFFVPIPDIHDGMHPLRHSTTVVQCH
ncbi:MAG: hypothetical protein D6682_04465 [Zetaproteobacteria bacterium]|nr:MAG: hypothetical protein D6682_04465 [Zetaproteobacteria bacterium]